MLMNAKKVEEAVALAKVAMQTEIGSSKDEQVRRPTSYECGNFSNIYTLPSEPM